MPQGNLSARWRRDLAVVAPFAGPATVDEVGDDLARRYAEPHRAYHTATHLREVLDAVEELLAAGEIDTSQAAQARLAAWFHDALYDTGAAPGANEAHSAELAAVALSRLGLPGQTIGAVRRLVRLTAGHNAEDAESAIHGGEDADSAIHGGDSAAGADGASRGMHDADLWILSAEKDRFDTYCAQVRQEYAAVPAQAYAAGRSAILAPFLARPFVYATAYARQRWEARARQNLRRELDRLDLLGLLNRPAGPA